MAAKNRTMSKTKKKQVKSSAKSEVLWYLLYEEDRNYTR